MSSNGGFDIVKDLAWQEMVEWSNIVGQAFPLLILLHISHYQASTVL